MNIVLFFITLVIFLTLIWFYKDILNKDKLKHSVTEPLTPCIGKSVRIITYEGSIGTDTDAELYNKLIPGSYIAYVDEGHIISHPEVGKKVDINLFIEHPIGIIYGIETLFPADKHWLMVNHEMLTITRFLRKIDKFICKTNYSKKLMTNLLKNKKYTGEIIYTKHTSSDIEPGKKDWNLFVHFAGKSHLKQTEKVLKAWIDNKGFSEFGSPKLVITCRRGCLNDRINYMLEDFVQCGNKKVHKDYPNIQVYSMIPNDEYLKLQRKAGVYICTSLTEGYGHYLNEGRSAGSVIITVDGPPMNELVTSENGILIEPRKKVPISKLIGSQMREGLAFEIGSNQVAEAVKKYYSLSHDEKVEKGRKSREMYLDDTSYLTITFKSLMNKNVKLEEQNCITENDFKEYPSRILSKEQFRIA
jgi:hypothetical protein